MKKILAIATLLALSLGLVGAVLAQPAGPNNCCKLRSDIVWQGDTYSTNNDVVKCTASACDYKKGETVGEKGVTCPIDGKPVENASPDWGMICFINTVDTITNWIFYVMTAIAVLLFIYGGLSHMIAMGDPDKASKARQVIIYAIIGLIIALVAKIVPAIVTTLVK
jgi:hypothetical protein